MLKIKPFLLAVALTASLSPTAFADQVGETADLVGLRELTTASDDHSIVRGSIFVVEANGLREYGWGGSNCPSRDLAADEVAILSRYLYRSQLQMIPYYKNGQLAGTRCLVGYSLVQRRYSDSIDPIP